jgi:hypothetical protein
MKRFFHLLSTLLLASVALTSCLSSSDDEVTLYNDAAITAFSLGVINRYQHTTSATTGNDTVVKTSITGSNYKMTIDQLGMKIYNRDSLPTGCDAAHVLCSVSAKNSGGIALKLLNDSLYVWFNSSDSINFTQPRTFRIFATDGSYYRDYEVSVNVAQHQGTDFAWQLQADTTLLASFSGMKAVSLGGRLLAFGQIEGHTRVAASANGARWQLLSSSVSTPFSASAWQNVVVKDGFAYMLSDGQLYRTADGEQWQQQPCTEQLSQLVGAATKELFALGTDGQLKTSTDDGQTWANELLDDSLSLLPTQGLAVVSFPYAPIDSADYVLLVGNNGNHTCVWRKISQYGGAQKGGQWVNMTVNSSFAQNWLPLQQQLSLVYYEGQVLATGTGKTVYQTPDQGITWAENTTFALPATLTGNSHAMTTGNDHDLWVISSTGQVWQGMKR